MRLWLSNFGPSPEFCAEEIIMSPSSDASRMEWYNVIFLLLNKSSLRVKSKFFAVLRTLFVVKRVMFVYL